MKKFVFVILSLFWLSTNAYGASPRDVLAHSCGDWSWFAHIVKMPNVVPTEDPGSNEQTECFVLQNAPGHQWRALPVVPGRAIGLAARSSQLAVLMADGQWLTLWAEGSATGQRLPGGGQMKVLTDDGDHLWAIGSIPGGLQAADKALATEAAATQPSTAPSGWTASSTALSEELRVARSIPSKMVLFKEVNGRWATVVELPADARMTDAQEMSLTIIGDEPLVSFKTDNSKLRTIQYLTNHTWKEAGWITTDRPVTNFSVLSDGFKPLLWCTTANSAGELFPDPAPHAPALELSWPGTEVMDGQPAATFAGGYICVFGPYAGKVLEQRYKSDATAVGVPAQVNLMNDLNDSLLPRWLEIVFLTAMGFSAGASVFQRMSETPKSRVKPPVAAPMLLRLSAGLLDALPLIGAVFFLGIRTEGLSNLSLVSLLSIGIILASGLLVYVLHTTLTEVFTGRSAGKWVFGLKVVTPDGSAPSRSQLLIRNLLRVIDPLVMIIISPLGQRSADAVAGTMVVPLVPLPEPSDDPMDMD